MGGVIRMPTARATRSVITGPAIPGRTGVTLLARVRMGSGQLATRAGLSSIAYAASDVTSGVALGSGTFALTTLSDTLAQGDPRWREDSAAAPGPDGAHGFNWAAELPASLFPLTTLAAPSLLAGPARAREVQVDVRFTPVTGEAFTLVFRFAVLPVYS